MTLESPAPLVTAFVALRALVQKTPSTLDEKSTQTLKTLGDAEATALRDFEAAGKKCLELLGEEVLGVLHGADLSKVNKCDGGSPDDPHNKEQVNKEQVGDADQSKQSVRVLFEQFDLDGDGLISCKDFKEDVLLGLGLGELMSDADVDRLVEAADEDKDGFINLTEFTNWLFSSSGKKSHEVCSRR